MMIRRGSSAMAFRKVVVASLALLLAIIASAAEGRGHHGHYGHSVLTEMYYEKTCPTVEDVVRTVMQRSVETNPRMAPAILRLFFHDCFVNGCDASVLLDKTTPAPNESEKDALGNQSLDGYEVIDEIKSALEQDCPATVSCADILAIASRDAVAMLGGPSWGVQLGRKDSLQAYFYEANTTLPSPRDNITELIRIFNGKGLGERDLAALSGAHTVGTTHSCQAYKDRIEGDENIDPSFLAQLRQKCWETHGYAKVPFDERTPTKFDNAYFQDLRARRGLLTSDQELTKGRWTSKWVKMYAMVGEVFFADFKTAMVKMGGLTPPSGTPLEVRLQCRKRNDDHHY